MKDTIIKYSDLAIIISGLYFGSDEEDLSDTEDLIDYLSKKEDEVVVVRAWGSGASE